MGNVENRQSGYMGEKVIEMYEKLRSKNAAAAGAVLVALSPYVHADAPYATVGRMETNDDVTVSIFYRDLPDTTWMRVGENITGIAIEESGKEPYFTEHPDTPEMRERMRELENAALDLQHSISYKGVVKERDGKIETERSFVREFPTFEEFVAVFKKGD